MPVLIVACAKLADVHPTDAGPTALERYADLLGLGLSAAVAAGSFAIGLRNWNRKRRKDRIDAYLERVFEVVAAAGLPGADRERYATDLRSIERQALAQLVAERLDADASFQIFLAHCRAAIGDLASTRAAPADPGGTYPRA